MEIQVFRLRLIEGRHAEILISRYAEPHEIFGINARRICSTADHVNGGAISSPARIRYAAVTKPPAAERRIAGPAMAAVQEDFPGTLNLPIEPQASRSEVFDSRTRIGLRLMFIAESTR
jgi:hypothetical protein